MVNFPMTARRFGTNVQAPVPQAPMAPQVQAPMAPQGPQGPTSFYEPQIAAIERQLAEPQQGMYTPEELEERRGKNEREYQLGMLAMLSGDKGLAGAGGEVFKQALAGRTPKTTEKGAYDPITGQWTYDPAWKREQLQTRLEKLQNLRSAESQANLTREDQQQARREAQAAQLQNALALRAVAAGSAGAGRAAVQEARNFTVEDRMADDFNRDTKTHNQVLDAYKNLQAISTRTDTMSDMAMIFSYMKMLDPTSVVREGEFANVQNAAGIPDRVRNMYNRAMTGNFLNAGQRGEILGTAGNIATQHEKSMNQYVNQYTSKAQRRGLNPENVTGQPPPAPPPPIDVGKALGATGANPPALPTAVPQRTTSGGW